MVLGFGNKTFLTNPAHYATPWQPSGGAPSSKTDAARLLKSYDYVIVGAGTAGSVLASRLTEDPNVSVLVLEAGGDNRGVLEAKIPLTFSKLFHGPNDWNYYTEPQPNVNNRELYWPRGRMIGGSSSMNAMMMHHCDAHDFDEWAANYGCKGWSYKDMQPYFRKSERFTPNPNRPAINPEHRGDSGPWQTGYSYLTEIGERGFIEGCKEIGIPYNPDINTPSGTLGVTRFQSFIDASGKRSSAATAYLPQNVLNRKNLDIATGAYVTKILFDVSSLPTPTAIGVELRTGRNAPLHHVHARKEVIVCSGAINTPQLLLLSGIGPREELEKHGIPVVKENNNVGEHMKDHFCTSGILCKAKPGKTLDYLGNDLKALPSLARWLVTGGGPLTSNVGEAAAFIRSVAPPCSLPPSSKADPKDFGSRSNGPDVEIIGAPLAYVHHGEGKAPEGADTFSLVPIGVRPQSEGCIKLKSKDVFDHPLIDPRYWSDPDENDRKVMLVGLRVCLEIIRTKAMQEYLMPVETNDDPTSPWWPYSASDIHAITDEQLRSWMGHTAFTLYHPVGTARLGTDPSQSVVDLQCCVHGTRGLRVIDASIFPQQVSGHPTAPIIAIAEKMSDVLRQSKAQL